MRRFSRCQPILGFSQHMTTSKLRHQKLFSIVAQCFILRGQLESSVAEEKELNPRLSKTLDEFIEIMDNLKLPYPKQIGKSKVVLMLLNLTSFKAQLNFEFKLQQFGINLKLQSTSRQFHFHAMRCGIINSRFSPVFNFVSLKIFWSMAMTLNFDYFSIWLPCWISCHRLSDSFDARVTTKKIKWEG